MVAERIAPNADLMSIPGLHISDYADRQLTPEEMDQDDIFLIRQREIRDANASSNAAPTAADISQNGAAKPPTDKTAATRYMVYLERMEALRTALEGLLIAKGMKVTEAINTVTKWVSSSTGRASAKAVAKAFGYDYLECQWIKVA